MTQLSLDTLFIVMDQDGVPQSLCTAQEEAQAAAAEISGGALPLSFLLAWWGAANAACVALDVAQETPTDAAESKARQDFLHQRRMEWRAYMGPTEPGPAEPPPAVDIAKPRRIDAEISEYLAQLHNSVVASQVKAVEVATLRGVTRERCNVASQMKAFARLIAAAAAQAPRPNVVVSAMSMLIVQELVTLLARAATQDVAGHA